MNQGELRVLAQKLDRIIVLLEGLADQNRPSHKRPYSKSKKVGRPKKAATQTTKVEPSESEVKTRLPYG